MLFVAGLFVGMVWASFVWAVFYDREKRTAEMDRLSFRTHVPPGFSAANVSDAVSAEIGRRIHPGSVRY